MTKVEKIMYLCKMFKQLDQRPFVVAGPCSAESREGLRSVATALGSTGRVSMVRAGVWKPRTRPGGFEGLGEPALVWMQELQDETGLPFCCEVVNPKQVELCLQHHINTLWIGARTTANPFLVSELCESLRGTGVAVMVKNPVCPDVRLWLGALERLASAGISQVAAVHRGFAMYHNHGYRNAPLWEVALELRRERPDVPVLCDPSHMGGRRDLVAPLAHTAMQLAYDGLMVEVHHSPDQALTDADQQITTAELDDLLAKLPVCKSSTLSSPDDPLGALRSQIDAIDRELLVLLAQRMGLSRQIAAVKRPLGLSVYQPDRWEAVVTDRLQQAEALGLDADFTKEILERIHAESVRVQL